MGAIGLRGVTWLLETARLDVRELERGDVDALFEVYGEREAMRFVGDGDPLDRAACERWVEVTEANVATRGYGMSALVLRETGQVVGFCGVVHPGGQREAELKFALRRDAWGKGLATEAGSGMLEHASRAHGLRTIIATVHPDNDASLRVLEKLGMKRRAERTNADGSKTLELVWTAPAR